MVQNCLLWQLCGALFRAKHFFIANSLQDDVEPLVPLGVISRNQPRLNCHGNYRQGFSQDLELGVQKYKFWGELGFQFCFIPLHYTQQYGY